jgi:integrase
MACFTANVGVSIRQLKLTTSTTDRKTARKIADELEDAARGARSPEQIRIFLNGIRDLKARGAAQRAFDRALRHTTGRGLGNQTTRAFIKAWLERTKGEVASATWAKYEQTTKLFLESLGCKSDQDMSAIRRDDIAAFRDAQAKRVAPSTANILLKVVRIMFLAAEADGVVARSEAKHVKRLKVRNEQKARRPFTLPELNRILTKCDSEWRSLVICGLYTGARLGDLATLTWQNVNLEQKTITFVTGKTDRPIAVPMAEVLGDHLMKLPAGDDPRAPLHPRAYGIVAKHGRVGMLSSQFYNILADAGLVKPRTHKVEDETLRRGRAAKRVTSQVSFHALRHTMVSLLKNAGVSDAVAQDIAGHESAEVSRLYTHIEDKVKREAVNKLPSIGPIGAGT